MDGDAFLLGDPFPNNARSLNYGIGKILFTQSRTHRIKDATGEAIGQDRLQTVAHFQAHSTVFYGQQQEYAFILFFRSNAPLAEKQIGHIFHRFAFQSVNGDNSHLRSGGLFNGSAIAFQLGFGCRWYDVCKVTNVPFWLERRKVKGKCECR